MARESYTHTTPAQYQKYNMPTSSFLHCASHNLPTLTTINFDLSAHPRGGTSRSFISFSVQFLHIHSRWFGSVWIFYPKAQRHCIRVCNFNITSNMARNISMNNVYESGDYVSKPGRSHDRYTLSRPDPRGTVQTRASSTTPHIHQNTASSSRRRIPVAVGLMGGLRVLWL